MSHTKVSSAPAPTSELPNPTMESPISSESSDTSDASSSPGTSVEWPIDEDRLPLERKDPKLQAYFFRMERALRTCHPAALHAEAVNLAQGIDPEAVDLLPSVEAVAEMVAKAGCRKVEYSRSCALVAREIFYQLQSTSQATSISFRDCLIGSAMKVFNKHYVKVNLWHLGGLNGLGSVEEEMLNVAAFVGDLFAMDLLPVEMVDESIIANLAFPNQLSTVHCRALHLFLLHAMTHVGPSIGLDNLAKIRRQLVRCSRGPPMTYDRMAQLWVIECCTVIERTTEQDRVARRFFGQRGPVSHQWDSVLSKDGWFSRLVS